MSPPLAPASAPVDPPINAPSEGEAGGRAEPTDEPRGGSDDRRVGSSCDAGVTTEVAPVNVGLVPPKRLLGGGAPLRMVSSLSMAGPRPNFLPSLISPTPPSPGTFGGASGSPTSSLFPSRNMAVSSIVSSPEDCASMGSAGKATGLGLRTGPNPKQELGCSLREVGAGGEADALVAPRKEALVPHVLDLPRPFLEFRHVEGALGDPVSSHEGSGPLSMPSSCTVSQGKNRKSCCGASPVEARDAESGRMGGDDDEGEGEGMLLCHPWSWTPEMVDNDPALGDDVTVRSYPQEPGISGTPPRLRPSDMAESVDVGVKAGPRSRVRTGPGDAWMADGEATDAALPEVQCAPSSAGVHLCCNRVSSGRLFGERRPATTATDMSRYRIASGHSRNRREEASSGQTGHSRFDRGQRRSPLDGMRGARPDIRSESKTPELDDNRCAGLRTGQPCTPTYISLSVQGMMCMENCGQVVQRALSRVGGVRNVTVHFPTRTASVQVCAHYPRARRPAALDIERLDMAVLCMK